MLMRRAMARGLAAADLDSMTLGMVMDYLIEAQNEETDARERRTETPTRRATQADIDAF